MRSAAQPYSSQTLALSCSPAGSVEAAAKWADPGGNMALATLAGFRVVVISSVWQRPRTTPTTHPS
ncbi:MAG TPA: hypothetical protein VMV08_03375 [Gaiellaceae bacterium]|nr:hypothetical protein [Gaiellaceae bacterium]